MAMSMTPKTALVWFRRDLRLDDHPALLAALDSCEHIVPVYIDDRAAQGDWTPGEASDWWLHHSLASLQDALEAKGSPLVIREGEALEVLRKLIEESGASEVHWNRLYEPWTRERDTTVKQALEADGLTVCSHNGSLLTEPWAVMTKTGTPYKVFTPYWRAAKPMAASAEPEDAPVALTPPKTPLHSQTLQSLGLLPDIRWDKGIEATWQPGERAAAEQAQRFAIDAASNYDEARNLPGIDGVSRLSPHLHFGELSIRRLWQIITSHTPESDGREVYLSELGWREFSHYALFHFPDTTDQPMNPKFRHFEWREDPAQLKAWQDGQTGIPIVDAGMRQLWQTGWMHNRVRMIVASFLVKNIRTHWLHGARWFWDTLVDADLPANTLGWQWSAGCGVDAAPYFRIFNPVSQGERFDPEGDYVRKWVPEVAGLPKKYVHAPWKLPAKDAERLGFELDRDYAAPIADLKTSRESALSAFKALKEVS